MDKSWMSTPRNTKTYMEGVESFLKFEVSNLKNNNPKEQIEIPCPCTRCVNHILQTEKLVSYHLVRYGFDQNYTIWTKHGEKSEDRPQSNINLEENYTYANNISDNVDSTDFTQEIPTDAAQTIEMVEATEENFIDDPEMFQKLLEDAQKPLYEGFPYFTKLSTIVVLLNVKSKHGVSDKCFTEFLVNFKKMLPKGNEMYSSTYEAKRAMKKIGSGYTKIHACVNDCILYRKQYEDMKECPTCGKSRWKVDEEKQIIYENVPAKVLWYFPIIDRLRRLYQSKNIAEYLRWHATGRKKDGVLRHPADSAAWAALDNEYPDFGVEPRNLRLGISADGVDVFRGNRHHSVWPILIVIYNLPPWLCMKRKFIMLSLLISGTPGNDIDVFLEPLIDDLKLLFDDGVETYDAFAEEKFTLRAAVLWTINDYPALGTLSGCPYSGKKGCVVCGEQTLTIRLPASNKESYVGHRRFLPYDHSFRRQRKAFNGQQDFAPPPDYMTGEEIYNQVKYIRNIWVKDKEAQVEQTSTGRGGKIRKRGKNKTQVGSSSVSQNDSTYWKKFNIWYRRLRYWRHNSIQHCLDFMHIEKNVVESLVGILLNIPGKSKDGLKARLDLAHFKLKLELQAKVVGDKTTLPPATYTLTTMEKDKFCETLYQLRVPQGYCSNFSSLVSRKDRKLIGLKSHDYHMLMQQFFPLAIRSIMPKPTRYAITRLCFFVRAIGSKEIKIEELDKLQEELYVTLCLLEKYFPPSFFVVMIYLTVHLVREVKLCGPVCFRWMYPFERCMKVIKGHVRNKSKPEGCIAEENVAEETLKFVNEFHKSMRTVGIPTYKHSTFGEENTFLYERTPLTKGTPVQVSADLFRKAHFYVLQNTPEFKPYVKRHMVYLENKHSGKGEAFIDQEHSLGFGNWLRKEVEKELAVSRDEIPESVRWISQLPNRTVEKHDGYYINGYSFRTQRRDGKVHQNSGVFVVATAKNIIKGVVSYSDIEYFRIIQEIWVLDYFCKKIPLFICDWVDSRKGVKKKDSLGYRLVDLKRLGHKNDPFIFASQAQQIFYVTDQLDPRLSIVIMTPPKNYRYLYEDGNEEFSIVVYAQNDNIFPSVDESRDDYVRTDCRGTVLRI